MCYCTFIFTERSTTREKSPFRKLKWEKKDRPSGTFNGKVIMIPTERIRRTTVALAARESGTMWTMGRWILERERKTLLNYYY
jgi:hypothetical protein